MNILAGFFQNSRTHGREKSVRSIRRYTFLFYFAHIGGGVLQLYRARCAVTQTFRPTNKGKDNYRYHRTARESEAENRLLKHAAVCATIILL